MTSYKNAFLNKNVLSRPIKSCKSSHFLNVCGSWLNSFWTHTLNALLPLCFNLDCFYFNNMQFPDLKFLTLFFTSNKSIIYWGAKPCNALKVIRLILYTILNLTGHQCNCFSISFTCSFLRFLKRNLAALFWTNCKCFSKTSGSPYNKLFA